MVVFETHGDNKCGVGCGVAPQPPTPLHTMGQKRCFWVTRMGVFEMDDAKKYCVGSGVAHQTPKRPPIPKNMGPQPTVLDHIGSYMPKKYKNSRKQHPKTSTVGKNQKIYARTCLHT